MKRYDKYVKANLEWFPEIPSHWTSIQIKNLKNGTGTLFIDGDWIESDVIIEDGIKYLTTGNIGAGKYKEQGFGFISEETFNSLNCTELFPGDLVISRLNEPIGRACIIPDLGYRIVTSVDNVILRPKAPFNKIYLMYVMNSPEYSNYTSLIARGATMKRISRGQLGRLHIPVPSEFEQNKISKYLDITTVIIDDLIENKEKLLEHIIEYRQSIIHEAVTKGFDHDVEMKDTGIEWLGKIPEEWNKVPLRYLNEKVGSGVTPKGGSEVYTEDGIIFIRSQNVHFDGLRLDDVARIDPETHEKMIGSKVQYKDVLLNITGASIGRNCVVNVKEEMNVNQHVCIIRPNNKINSDYLNLVLQSDVGQKQVRLQITGGNREGLTFEAVKDFIIPLPPKSVQLEIVSKINLKMSQFEELTLKTRNQIDLLKEYRQSLISEAVTGKIDVSNWNPEANKN